MTPAEHYAEAMRLIIDDGFRYPPSPGNIALAQVRATLALYHPPVEFELVGNQQPRVWPQDHATDLTVVGPVLTEEPGPEVSVVIDGEGDRFQRYPGSRYWQMHPSGARYGWDELIPPVRRSAS